MKRSLTLIAFALAVLLPTLLSAVGCARLLRVLVVQAAPAAGPLHACGPWRARPERGPLLAARDRVGGDGSRRGASGAEGGGPRHRPHPPEGPEPRHPRGRGG